MRIRVDWFSVSSVTGVTLWHKASALTASCTRVTTVRRTCGKEPAKSNLTCQKGKFVLQQKGQNLSEEIVINGVIP